jgi:hypothetical protein
MLIEPYMKDHEARLTIADEEQRLARVLQQWLVTDKEGCAREKSLVKFRSALTYLLAAHLEQSPAWDHERRWIDDVHLSLSFADVGIVHGIGKMWWGDRRNPSAGLVSVDLQARMQLLTSGAAASVNYMLIFDSEGVRFSLHSAER